ncbi:DNA-directed RNA polymerase core subunit RPC10 [Paracoccidioides brasiliensis Pb18]|uniref:DNA-directed RNA polymerase I, II, and III subunit RPABC4 n=1 Tax=Paracoccidioides brasiliensis (strain Pb18) TaxID=502780 RepID=C1G4C4_PARBD|nr:DNA-directed RNA polymerase core subunit RPC10 [Paracoccidioides brasiliensis Pb18]EEH45640.2 hypothetical protein PADG_01790 [Paracoccidioides brasiliensis Pb18]
MSREAYQVPTAQTGYAGVSGVVEGAASDAISVVYVCGDCNSRVSMKRGDQIRCKECGHRVLYKERTKRPDDNLSDDLMVTTVDVGGLFMMGRMCSLPGVTFVVSCFLLFTAPAWR